MALVRHHPASIETINTNAKQNQRFVPLRRLRDNDDAVKKALKDAIQATNLDASAFPLHDIKRLYAMRWGIEKLTQKSSASFTCRVA